MLPCARMWPTSALSLTMGWNPTSSRTNTFVNQNFHHFVDGLLRIFLFWLFWTNEYILDENMNERKIEGAPSNWIPPHCVLSLHVHFGGKIDCFLWLQQIFTTTRSIYHPVSVCKFFQEQNPLLLVQDILHTIKVRKYQKVFSVFSHFLQKGTK